MIISDAPAYEITRDGKVINIKTGHTKKTFHTWAGYEMTSVYCPSRGRVRVVSIHRLLAIAYIPNPDNLPQVHHIDHNPGNNHLSNLMWVTARQNYDYRKTKGIDNKHNVRIIYGSKRRNTMPKGFKTINVNDQLYEKLGDLADKTAGLEGLSKVSLSQMIERMVKVYEDKLAA